MSRVCQRIHTPRIALIGIMAGLLLHATTALAQVTAQDLQVAGRALSFLTKPLTGEVKVGIVYASGSPQSVQEAQGLQRLLADGLKVGNLTLKPALIPVTEIARANVGLIFLAPGTGEEAKGVAQASKAKHVPCVTTDLSQVKSGYCALGVRSQPKIEILVNRAAAADSDTTFSTIFRVMITEI
jgi:ABC-type uncharacterized transport system substrate-binding protein